MNFEAKFLNLTNDAYKICIVNPTDPKSFGENLQINQFDLKKILCPNNDNTFLIHNLTNPKEELYFKLPRLDLFTLEKDYSINSTFIKNDSKNMRFIGEPTDKPTQNIIEEHVINFKPNAYKQINTTSNQVESFNKSANYSIDNKSSDIFGINTKYANESNLKEKIIPLQFNKSDNNISSSIHIDDYLKAKNKPVDSIKNMSKSLVYEIPNFKENNFSYDFVNATDEKNKINLNNDSFDVNKSSLNKSYNTGESKSNMSGVRDLGYLNFDINKYFNSFNIPTTSTMESKQQTPSISSNINNNFNETNLINNNYDFSKYNYKSISSNPSGNYNFEINSFANKSYGNIKDREDEKNKYNSSKVLPFADYKIPENFNLRTNYSISSNNLTNNLDNIKEVEINSHMNTVKVEDNKKTKSENSLNSILEQKYDFYNIKKIDQNTNLSKSQVFSMSDFKIQDNLINLDKNIYIGDKFTYQNEGISNVNKNNLTNLQEDKLNKSLNNKNNFNNYDYNINNPTSYNTEKNLTSSIQVNKNNNIGNSHKNSINNNLNYLPDYSNVNFNSEQSEYLNTQQNITSTVEDLSKCREDITKIIKDMQRSINFNVIDINQNKTNGYNFNFCDLRNQKSDIEFSENPKIKNENLNNNKIKQEIHELISNENNQSKSNPIEFNENNHLVIINKNDNLIRKISETEVFEAVNPANINEEKNNLFENLNINAVTEIINLETITNLPDPLKEKFDFDSPNKSSRLSSIPFSEDRINLNLPDPDNFDRFSIDRYSKKESVVKISKKNQIENRFRSNLDINQSFTNNNSSIFNDSQIRNYKKKINIDLDSILLKYNFNNKIFDKSFYGQIFKNNKFLDNFDINNIFNDTRQGNISIKNYSKNILFIRLSSDNENKDDEEFKEIQINEQLIFKRIQGKIYKLQYILNKKNPNGPVYTVYCGCQYNIKKNLKLYDIDENDLVVSGLNYYKTGMNNNKIRILFYQPENISNFEFLQKFNFNKYITIFNGSLDEFKIRIKSDENSDVKVYTVFSLMAIIFERKNDQAEYLTIIKQHDKIMKFILKSGEGYILDNDSMLINGKNREIIEYTQLNFDFGEHKKRDDDLLKISVDLTRQNEDLYFKFDVSQIDEDNFNEFNIENENDQDIYIRTEKKEEGDENFILLNKNSNVWILREDGLFLLEIVLKDLSSKRYIISTGCCYIFSKDLNLVEAVTKKLIPNTIERFSDGNLIYGKINKEINYSLEKNNQNNNKDSFDNSLEYFNNIKSKHYRGKKFTDENFPPRNHIISAVNPNNKKRNITNNPHSQRLISEKLISYISFKRPDEFFDENKICLIKEKFDFSDDSSNTYDCFLASILFCLFIHDPEIIKKIFKNLEINSDGFYELYFYENGEKKLMFIDDYLPIINKKLNDDEKCYFSVPRCKEIWLSLLEKAYAKYEGGYSNIIDGNVISEIHFFTGAISFKYLSSDLNLWNNILSCCNNGAVVMAGCNEDNIKTEEYGITSYIYSILNSYEYDKGNELIKLVKIKNPSGLQNWTGDYCKNSKKWNVEMKKLFDVELAYCENGVFFMSFEDFVSSFDFTVISYVD